VEIVKCDMHVHSYFSGPCLAPVVGAFCRESYSAPEVYETLARRNMDLFTLTDHDSIEGSEKLRKHANFFLSEELTCRMPSGTEVHIGVYDFHERQHEELQQRRNDLVALLMYLTERKIFFSVNHVFSNLTGRREREDFAWIQAYVPAIEARNGYLLEEANEHAMSLAKRWDKIALGGSDAHGLLPAGKTYTEVPGARDKQEFFAGLRGGLGKVKGEGGCFRKLTRDVTLVALEMMREKPWTALLTPLVLLIPAATFWNCRSERAFARRWAEEILGPSDAAERPRWSAIPQPAAEESV
jgi:predicted metal-dependent phosphoesterase TrpH